MAKTVLQILKDNITDPSVFFVFPTQVAADAWADALLDASDSLTIALERFSAWDDFKGSSIRSQQQDKTSIPSVLRKLFAARLIAQNAELAAAGSTPLFASLINPDYADEASSFTDWIASLLPQLALWKSRQKAAPTDPEDIDLERLYETYRDFLAENKLFDPAWETPPFDARGNRYIIFYPEILEDFAEYQNLLEESPCITLVKADDLVPLSQTADAPASCSKDTNRAYIRTFSNSRAELHALVLEILRSHEEDGIPYEDMAVSIDRDELLLPYIERELALYSVPVKSRIAQPLTARGAGMLFPQIQECVSSHFSFEAVKDLLLNNDLPWKEKQLNMELINFGIRNSCLCSYEKSGQMLDVWKDAFDAYPHEERLVTFYDMLKLRLENIARAETFKDIEDSYFAFRKDFFNENAFTEQADNVLGRCIKELAELIRIQEDFPGIKISGAFSFYTSLLSATKYLAQSNKTGVLLYPYRDAAAAPKARHFVPASGQDQVTVTYCPLRFLSEEKRAELGAEDLDVSSIFLKMYGQNSVYGTWYSCAEKSFAGYTLPHSALPGETAHVPEENDPVTEQREWLSGQSTAFPAIVSETDKTGFSGWSTGASVLTSPDTALSGIDRAKLYEGDKIRISETALKEFFACPHKWYYNQCLILKPFSLEAELMEDVWIGTLYHLIMEHFFSSIKKEPINQILRMDAAPVQADYCIRMENAVDHAFDRIKGSPLSKELLKKQKEAYLEKVRNCLTEFCDDFAGCRVEAIEKNITMPIPGKDYIYKGKIDLVLRSGDGEIILIDFKTGSCPSKTACFPDPNNDNRLKDFQFAMYVKLWEYEHPDEDDIVQQCHFYKIKECSKFTIVGKTARDKKRDDLESSITMLDDYADLYAAAIKAGTLDAGCKPTFTDCAGCKFKAICRSTYTVSGDKTLLQGTEDNNE